MKNNILKSNTAAYTAPPKQEYTMRMRVPPPVRQSDTVHRPQTRRVNWTKGDTRKNNSPQDRYRMRWVHNFIFTLNDCNWRGGGGSRRNSSATGGVRTCGLSNTDCDRGTVGGGQFVSSAAPLCLCRVRHYLSRCELVRSRKLWAVLKLNVGSHLFETVNTAFSWTALERLNRWFYTLKSTVW